FEQAQSWLQECATGSHEACDQSPPSYRPTRLLDLASNGSPLRKETYLAHGESDGFTYAALSHCWGVAGSKHLKTTRVTMSSWKRGIPWTLIPRTFQDAILFTRRLGIRWLWIDSLCIIQEDENDWRAEAACMAEVYSQAYFTIAAASAENSEVGIFREPSAESQNNASGCQDLLVYAKRQSKYSLMTSNRYRLMTRAWAYQERYLSPRVIYFLGDELGWSCRSLDDDESHSGTFSSLSFALDKKHNPYLHPQEGSPDKEADEYDHIKSIDHWHHIVNDYDTLFLSFERDRLPALAGLAKHLSPFRKGRYLAGLWEDSLIVDLLWKMYAEPINRSAFRSAP
ncbi:HET-domain-containing protein, partial [Lophiostoma macrostomum CBS 122681]